MLPYYKIFTDKTSIPEPIALTGTFTTNGTTATIINGGNDIKQGDYLYDNAQNEFRKTTSDLQGNRIQIESKFTNNITSPIAMKIVDRVLFSVINISNEGAANGLLLGSVLKSGKSRIFSDWADEMLAPIVIDGTGTSLAITGMYQKKQ